MDKASRPFVDPGLAQLKAVLLGLFLAVEDHAPDASNFYDRAKLPSAEDCALRVPIKSGCEIWNCGTSNQRILVSFDSPLFSHTVTYTEIIFRCQSCSQTWVRYYRLCRFRAGFVRTKINLLLGYESGGVRRGSTSGYSRDGFKEISIQFSQRDHCW
jgi:hypothetical protein